MIPATKDQLLVIKSIPTLHIPQHNSFFDMPDFTVNALVTWEAWHKIPIYDGLIVSEMGPRKILSDRNPPYRHYILISQKSICCHWVSTQLLTHICIKVKSRVFVHYSPTLCFSWRKSMYISSCTIFPIVVGLISFDDTNETANLKRHLSSSSETHIIFISVAASPHKIYLCNNKQWFRVVLVRRKDRFFRVTITVNDVAQWLIVIKIANLSPESCPTWNKSLCT